MDTFTGRAKDMQTDLETKRLLELELGRLDLNPWPLLTYLKKKCVSEGGRALGRVTLTL